MARIRIAIDAGHGSNTAGKRTSPFTKDVDVNNNGSADVMKGEQYREHYANVGVCNILYDILECRGYDLIKTGWDNANSKDDPDESLSSRQKKIKNFITELSVSVHFNASGGNGMKFNNADGVGIYIHDKHSANSKALAEYILSELTKGSKQDCRGITKQGLSLCNCKTMGTAASILCELAFMTNEHEAQELMANDSFWLESAMEIFNGIEKYILNSYLTTPLSTVTQRSSENDIRWLQIHINEAMKFDIGFVPLVVDGKYGELSRQAVLSLWEHLGWNKDGKDTGWRAGMTTINKISELIK